MDINIAVCFDKDFAWLLPIFCNSLLSCNSRNKIKLHIVSNSHLIDLETKGIDYEFYVHDISDYEYIGLKHVTKSTMLRLFLPKILKDVEGNILYLDLDVIVNCNLDFINSYDTGVKGISAKTGYLNNVSIWKKLYNSSLSYKHKKSFNAGVLVMNLDILRNNSFSDYTINLWKKHPECNDQYLINVYCDNQYIELPRNYNILNNHKIDRKYFNDYQPSQYILHYAGRRKPWGSWKRDEVYCYNTDIWEKYNNT